MRQSFGAADVPNRPRRRCQLPSVRVEPVLFHALDDIAQREERSMSDVIRELLRVQVQQRLLFPTGAPRP
ncbi:ribbon-helix-helix domain-containing protein [Luteimonas sp. A1P009]|uniref:Ribbon-helix-helix domain-containing protein n=1 Tax=Luteimonas fraxinea TaxID=2901869 RepID=A0ABS8UB04_9GAMM|nr:ribbon-helix-helix domain-containing protein [Luteimonas fraxinea]